MPHRPGAVVSAMRSDDGQASRPGGRVECDRHVEAAPRDAARPNLAGPTADRASQQVTGVLLGCGRRAPPVVRPMRRRWSVGGVGPYVLGHHRHMAGGCFVERDTPAQWVRGGEALERIWLTATVRGLALTPMSQLTEISALRDLLTDAATRSVPQTVLRIGYPLTPALASPRRPLADLMVRNRPPASR